MDRPIKVRLKQDLTKYAIGLVSGVEGVTAGRLGMWSRGSDRFITVRFPGFATLDVLWNSLESIDDDYLREAEVLEKKKQNELQTATNVIRYLDRGEGFNILVFLIQWKKG